MAAAERKGPKVDPERSDAPNPDWVPQKDTEDWEKLSPFLWNPCRLRDMTYTQFWTLISEGRIEKASFSCR